jgi:hypothetical protein
MCTPCMVYHKVLNEMWQSMRCIFCPCGFEPFGLACTLVPYIRVLCPWKWILAFQGLVFFLSLWI